MIYPAHASDGTLLAEPNGMPLEKALRALGLSGWLDPDGRAQPRAGRYFGTGVA